MAGLSLTREDDADPQTVRALSDGLDGYNAAFLPGYDLAPKPRHGLCRDAAGALQGGARYHLALEWAVLEWLWIAEPFRRAGLGGRLLDHVEAKRKPKTAAASISTRSAFRRRCFIRNAATANLAAYPTCRRGSTASG